MDVLYYLAPLAGLVSLIFAGFFARSVLKEGTGSKEMQAISAAIQEGAMAYLNRQYKTIAVVAIILAVLIYALLPDGDKIAIGFLNGCHQFCYCRVHRNERVCKGKCKDSACCFQWSAKATHVAFRRSVTGLAVVGLALLGTSGFYILYGDVDLVVGFGFGASLISLFARVGGGIFTKAADVGADLVGKIEAGIPEDDPRNAAVIADNGRDNVGDCAGMGADLFETYVVTVLASMLLGSIIIDKYPNAILYPLLLGASAIIASVISVFFVKIGSDGKIMKALYKGVAGSAIISLVFFYFITDSLMNRYEDISCCCSGYSDHGPHESYRILHFYEIPSCEDNCRGFKTGAGTNVISGLAIGFESTALPVITIVLGILVYFIVGGMADPEVGLYGIAVAAAAMLSTTGMIVALDSYGPITDNAGGIAEMAGMPSSA